MAVPLVVIAESFGVRERCDELMFDGRGEQFGRIDRGLAPEYRFSDFAFHPVL